MILEQHYLDCLSQASYFLADESSKVAAIVDPRRDIGLYLTQAETLGVEIKHVFLTHFHADFVAGHLELQQRTGATIHLGAAATAEYPFEPMRDGDFVDLGPELRLKFLATPGHTPESTCLLVIDRKRAPKKAMAVLTGDTLFVGDVGRPDLMVSVGHSADDLAKKLYHSLQDKILPLHDELLVYPGHGAGSPCGKSLGNETVTTLGDQRQFNYALRAKTEDEFVKIVTAGQDQAPAYFGYDARLNQQMRPVLEDSLKESLRPLDFAALVKAQEQGAQILDTRAPSAFASGFLGGSINIGLGGRFAEWAGQMLALDRPIILIAEPGSEREAAVRLGRIGFDHVAGYLEGGLSALPGSDAHQLRRYSPRELAEALESNTPPTVLDVRGPAERAQSSLPGSLHIPLPELRDRMDELPADKPLVVHCKGGYRSMIASSVLVAGGHSPLGDLEGGIDAWSRHLALT